MEKNGDRKKKLVVDISPFFLYEAAGDSEGDLDHHNMMMMMGMRSSSSSSSCLDNEEDDAQSCSYDVWEAYNTSPHINEARSGTYKITSTVVHSYGSHHSHGHNVNDDDNDDGKMMIKNYARKGKHDDNEIGCSREDYNNKCTSEVMSTANSNSSRKSCIDSIQGKKMSEKERSRLFWETCLAS